MSSKRVLLQDKNGNQVMPITDASNVYYAENKTVKDAIDDGIGTVITDSQMSSASLNPVENRVIKAYVDDELGAVESEIENAKLECIQHTNKAVGDTAIMLGIKETGETEYLESEPDGTYKKIAYVEVNHTNYPSDYLYLNFAFEGSDMGDINVSYDSSFNNYPYVFKPYAITPGVYDSEGNLIREVTDTVLINAIKQGELNEVSLSGTGLYDNFEVGLVCSAKEYADEKTSRKVDKVEGYGLIAMGVPGPQYDLRTPDGEYVVFYPAEYTDELIEASESRAKEYTDNKLTDYPTFNDYAKPNAAGLVKGGLYSFSLTNDGYPFSDELTFEKYNNYSRNNFISKGTLENVAAARGWDTALDSSKAYTEDRLGEIANMLGLKTDTEIQYIPNDILPGSYKKISLVKFDLIDVFIICDFYFEGSRVGGFSLNNGENYPWSFRPNVKTPGVYDCFGNLVKQVTDSVLLNALKNGQISDVRISDSDHYSKFNVGLVCSAKEYVDHLILDSWEAEV